MFGFFQIKDRDFFNGAELIQVCIGSNEIILNFFPNDMSITIFNVREFLENNSFMFESLMGISKRIRQIGKTVTGLSILSNDSAVIKMSDGSEILLKDDSAEYEAVTFQADGQTIVI